MLDAPIAPGESIDPLQLADSPSTTGARPRMNPTEQESPLSLGTSVEERIERLRRAVADKSIHALAKDERFALIIDNLVEDVLALGPDPSVRAGAVAALGRVRAIHKVKTLEPRLRRALGKLLTERIELNSVGDGDDRYYVVAGCRVVDAGWILEQLAATAVQEESLEKGRREAVLGLFEKSRDVEEALLMLAHAMRSWSPTTEAPSDTAAKRAKRLLATIGEVLAVHESDVECEPGRALGTLLLATVKGGANPSAKVMEEVAVQTLTTVHGLVRSRFSLAAQPSTYDAIRALRDLFPRDGWPRWLASTQNQAPKLALQRDLIQALTLVVKQGKCDDALFGQLAVLSGSRDSAREAAKRIAATVHGLPPDVQAWLTTGERGGPTPNAMAPSSLALESRMLQEDVSIARLLREVARFSANGEVLRQHLLPELEVVAPQYVRNVDGLLAQVRMIDQGVGRLAERRALRARGQPGDVVEYAPIEHQLVDTQYGAAVRWVRLMEPVIERVGKDGVTVVVEKALAEPVSSRTEPPSSSNEG